MISHYGLTYLSPLNLRILYPKECQQREPMDMRMKEPKVLKIENYLIFNVSLRPGGSLRR